MPKSRIILAIGFFVALLPVLGFPHAWESFFEVAGGLGIVLLSVLISVDKRLSQKAKAERRLATRRSRTKSEIMSDAIDAQPAQQTMDEQPNVEESTPVQE